MTHHKYHKYNPYWIFEIMDVRTIQSDMNNKRSAVRTSMFETVIRWGFRKQNTKRSSQLDGRIFSVVFVTFEPISRQTKYFFDFSACISLQCKYGFAKEKSMHRYSPSYWTRGELNMLKKAVMTENGGIPKKDEL